MTRVRNSLKWTQSDAIAEALSAESCHIVLETSPPDYVEKISRYLESTVGHSRQDEVSNDPAEAESDSGDSLFITQKPVPEAVRTAKRHRYSLRSTTTSPGDLQESEDDTSSSASHGESKTDKKKRKNFRLPKYSFPFLTEKKWKPNSTLLPVQQNTRLHNATMGGFFKCVQELWQGYARGDDVALSIPTLDMNGEYISPLSEEEERSEDEDIKVVEKRRFVAPSKAKCSQPWNTPAKSDSPVKQQRRRRRRRASQEMSQGTQRKILPIISTKTFKSRATLSSSTDSSDDGDPSCRVLPERKTSVKHVTSDTSILAQTETPKTKRRLTRGKIIFQEKEQEEELCNDSDATVCEPPKLQEGPREHTQMGREAATTVTEAQADAFHTDELSQTGQAEDEPESQSLLQSLPELVSDINNDRVCSETRVKKKKKKAKGDHASVEEVRSQSQEESDGLHVAAPVNVVLELNEKNWTENLSRDDNMLRQEERNIPDSTQTKKKRKKSTAENIRQEVSGNFESDVRLEDSGFSITCNVENPEQEKKKKKKKRRKRSLEDDEGGDEQVQSSTVVEHLNDDVKEIGNYLENTEVSQESLESSNEKKKRKKKQQSSCINDSQVGEENGVDMSLSNDLTLEGSTGLSVKRKKKKKKRESVSERVDISYTPDKNKVENADNSQKTVAGPDDQDAEHVIKKKKKKKREKISSRNGSEDTVLQSDEPVSVRKKEKKRTSSFLDADSEKKDAQSHQQQSSSSESVAAHVWGAEKPGVSTGDVEIESAEINGNSGDGIKKKKRTRKMSTTQENVEVDHKPDFEEPNETCQMLDNTHMGVKRKKKRKRTESEYVTPMESLDSAADEEHTQTNEAVVLKKKRKKKKYKDEQCHVIQESPPAASEESESERASVNRKKNVAEHASPLSEKTGNQALNDVKHKKKKKKLKSIDNVLLEGKLFTESVEMEADKTKKKQRHKPTAVPSFISNSPETSPSRFEMSSSGSIMKNKHIKSKRRLHNPSEDFLTDS